MVNGTAEFEKLQIKEVTSHFRNGWIFFVVYAKMPSIFAKSQKNADGRNNAVEIDFMDIKPLIIENVTVKAKKMKLKGSENIEKVQESNLSFEKSPNEKIFEDELVFTEKE